MELNLIESPVHKPLTEECYHYHMDGTYVGAVWLDEGEWRAHCTHPGNYGILNEFPTKELALEALKKAVIQGIQEPHPING